MKGTSPWSAYRLIKSHSRGARMPCPRSWNRWDLDTDCLTTSSLCIDWPRTLHHPLSAVVKHLTDLRFDLTNIQSSIATLLTHLA